MIRVCRLCDRARPIEEFYRHRGQRRTECKDCYREARRRWKKEHYRELRAAREKAERTERNAQIRKLYEVGGHTYRELGDRFGLSYEGIRRIIDGGKEGLPILPLREALRAWLEKDGNSMKHLGRLVAFGRDGEATTAERWVYRVLASSAHFIPVAAADEICIAMGLHPFEVYGEEWLVA